VALRFELTHAFSQGRPVVELLAPFDAQNWSVPAGFKTDFASIPAPLVWLIPVFGRSCRAAVLHDFLCWQGADRTTRSRAFLQQMLHDRVPTWQAWVQYLAVRWWPGSEKVRE
jgi:hypothetical protein